MAVRYCEKTDQPTPTARISSGKISATRTQLMLLKKMEYARANRNMKLSSVSQVRFPRSRCTYAIAAREPSALWPSANSFERPVRMARRTARVKFPMTDKMSATSEEVGSAK